MAAASALTIRSPTALITRHLENTWATGGLPTNVTRIVAVVIPIEILTVTATIAVEVATIGIGIGTPMDVIVVTGVTDAVQLPVGAAADDIRPTTGVAGATPEARPAEAAPPEAPDETMRLRPQLLQRMRLGGERHRQVKIKMRSSIAECRSGLLPSARFQFKLFKVSLLYP